MAKYKRAFFREGDRYIFLTGAAPRGFAGVLGITWEGPLNQLAETARPLDQLAKLEQVEPAAVPLAWWEGFRKATGLLAERKEPTPPQPKQEPPQPKQEPPQPKQEPPQPKVEDWTLPASIGVGALIGLLVLKWLS